MSPAHIRELLQLQPVLGRVALSRRVCQELGQPKEMSARVALRRMEQDGLIQMQKQHRQISPLKNIWVYPLH